MGTPFIVPIVPTVPVGYECPDDRDGGSLTRTEKVYLRIDGFLALGFLGLTARDSSPARGRVLALSLSLLALDSAIPLNRFASLCNIGSMAFMYAADGVLET